MLMKVVLLVTTVVVRLLHVPPALAFQNTACCMQYICDADSVRISRRPFFVNGDGVFCFS